MIVIASVTISVDHFPLVASTVKSLLAQPRSTTCHFSLSAQYAMSDQPQPSVIDEAIATGIADAPREAVSEQHEILQSGVGSTDDIPSQPDSKVDEEDEQLSAIEQSAISLHDQLSARSLSPTDQPITSSQSSRPSTSSAQRPASAFNLPVDPRFPSDPSPQLLAVLQAADEADRLTANSHSPLLSERSAAAAGRAERPESAAQLGGMDTLQGLPSQSLDYAWSVVQSRMAWRESTRAERAARVERRKDEIAAEFEAEIRGAFSLPAATKLPAVTHAHNKTASAKLPLPTAVPVA